MVTRTAQDSDAPFIQELLRHLGYHVAQSDIVRRIHLHTRPEYRIQVAEIDEKVIGFISLHWFDLLHLAGPVGRISSFCVDPDFRSKGVGMKLMEDAEQFFKSAGCVKIEVTSNNRRTMTHDFYLKRGYVEDSKRFVKYV